MQKDLLIDFTLMYNKFKKPLFNYACKIVKSEMFAEDICHDVFLKLYDNLERIRDSKRIEIWIFTTCRNEIFGHFRKIKNRIEESIDLHEEKFSTNCLFDDFERKELINLIEEELNEMDSSQRILWFKLQRDCGDNEYNGRSCAKPDIQSSPEIKNSNNKIRKRLR